MTGDQLTPYRGCSEVDLKTIEKVIPDDDNGLTTMRPPFLG